MSVPIGRRFDNKPLMLPWAPCPHVLIGGQTGAGKSGVTNAIIAAVAGRDDTAICGIDLKLVEQWPWRRRLTTCATTTAEADRLMADLRALIQHRAKLLQAIGRRMWSSEFGPWVLVVVDELAELSGSDPDILIEAARTGDTKDVIRNGRNAAQIRIALLGSLARLARFCGTTIVTATQYPSYEVIDQQIRTQLTIRIMLRVASGEQVDVCLGRGYASRIGVRSIPADQPGGFWVVGLPSDPEPVRGRAHFLTDDFIAAHAARTAHLAWPHDAVFGPATELPEAS